MTIVEMLEQSGVLTLLGMGIVVLFLAILIVCVTLMGKIIHALGAAKSAQRSAVTQSQSARPAALPANSAAKLDAVTAAITAADYEYRKT
jgi:oxaloacetate decarboxylase gamma subunit